jgi:hypothetical protein
MTPFYIPSCSVTDKIDQAPMDLFDNSYIHTNFNGVPNFKSSLFTKQPLFHIVKLQPFYCKVCSFKTNIKQKLGVHVHHQHRGKSSQYAKRKSIYYKRAAKRQSLLKKKKLYCKNILFKNFDDIKKEDHKMIFNSKDFLNFKRREGRK